MCASLAALAHSVDRSLQCNPCTTLRNLLFLEAHTTDSEASLKFASAHTAQSRCLAHNPE